MPAMATVDPHLSLADAATSIPLLATPQPSASPGRKMLQGRTRRIDVGYRQHPTLLALACKHTRIGRFVFDNPTSRPMLGHSAQESTLQVTPRRK